MISFLAGNHLEKLVLTYTKKAVLVFKQWVWCMVIFAVRGAERVDLINSESGGNLQFC